MSKRKVSYVKPEDPTFLAKLKKEIGYKDGPTVESKKGHFDRGDSDSDEVSGLEEETPQIVVLNPSTDLSAEEVAAEKIRLKQEQDSEPADLNKRIVFSKGSLKNKSDSKSKTINKKKSTDTTKLSFQLEEEELLD